MQCKAKTTNGNPCQANAMTKNDYCYLHSPNVSEEEKQKISRKGGKKRALVNERPSQPVPLESPNHVVLLLADTINQVREGKMDIRTANCLGFLSGHIVRALELTEVHQRLKRIEEILSNKPS